MSEPLRAFAPGPGIILEHWKNPSTWQFRGFYIDPIFDQDQCPVCDKLAKLHHNGLFFASPQNWVYYQKVGEAVCRDCRYWARTNNLPNPRGEA